MLVAASRELLMQRPSHVVSVQPPPATDALIVGGLGSISSILHAGGGSVTLSTLHSFVACARLSHFSNCPSLPGSSLAHTAFTVNADHLARNLPVANGVPQQLPEAFELASLYKNAKVTCVWVVPTFARNKKLGFGLK